MKKYFFNDIRVFILTFYFIVLVIWNLILYFLPDKNSLVNYSFNLAYAFIYLYGGIIGYFSSGKLSKQSPIKISLKYFGFGLIFWGIAGLTWSFYNIVLKVTIPYPSLADIFFVLYVPFFVVGLIKLVTIYQDYINLNLLIEIILFLVVTLILVNVFIYQPNVSENLNLLTKTLNLYYPIADAVLLLLIYIILRTSGGRIHPPVMILAFGFASQVLGDFIFTRKTISGLYWNGDLSDFFFALSGYLITLGIIFIQTNFQKDLGTAS